MDPGITRAESSFLGTVPLRPWSAPPTRATTSSEDNLSHSPSVARTIKRLGDGVGCVEGAELVPLEMSPNVSSR